MDSALIVFAKRPEPGTVKTRLGTVLTPEEAARLYEAFLRDALLQYAALDVAVRLYLAPPAGPVPDDLIPQGVSVHEQQGPGLGARMKIAFVESFAAGFERLVIIGTDHPTLPSAYVERAFEALHAPQSICLGPSDDGGFYLLGMNDFYPELFHDMQYSRDDVFAETLARAGRTQAHLAVLPPWYDVDTPDALRRLAGDLNNEGEGGMHTRRVVAELLTAYPMLAP